MVAAGHTGVTRPLKQYLAERGLFNGDRDLLFVEKKERARQSLFINTAFTTLAHHDQGERQTQTQSTRRQKKQRKGRRINNASNMNARRASGYSNPQVSATNSTSATARPNTEAFSAEIIHAHAVGTAWHPKEYLTIQVPKFITQPTRICTLAAVSART